MSLQSWIRFVHQFGLRIKENVTGDVYIWGSSRVMGERMRLHVSESLGLHWSSTIIWVKDQFTLGRSKYQNQCEMGWHGYVEESSQNTNQDNQDDPDDQPESLIAGDDHALAQYGWFKKSSFNDETRNQTDIWLVDKPDRSSEHPTMKPLELLEIGIRNSSRPRDLVIDFFLGSNSTLHACENLGRRCKGAELQPAYVAVTLERFLTYTGAQPELISGDDLELRVAEYRENIHSEV